MFMASWYAAHGYAAQLVDTMERSTKRNTGKSSGTPPLGTHVIPWRKAIKRRKTDERMRKVGSGVTPPFATAARNSRERIGGRNPPILSLRARRIGLNTGLGIAHDVR